MRASLRKRYLDLLCSVYLYNEHRGYTGLDRILAAVRETHPRGDPFIAKIEKHRADERKHYVMFQRWFERRGEMPYLVGRAGQIDGLIEMFFGTEIDGLEADAIKSSEAKFAKLCRAIALTERRGMRLVQELLSSPLVKTDPHLIKILRVIERDEPSHWEPYEEWLRAHGHPQSRLAERIADSVANVVLVFGKFPLMLVSPALPRRTDWPDAGEVAPARSPADEPLRGLAGGSRWTT
jgi:hypothetical protein